MEQRPQHKRWVSTLVLYLSDLEIDDKNRNQNEYIQRSSVGQLTRFGFETIHCHDDVNVNVNV